MKNIVAVSGGVVCIAVLTAFAASAAPMATPNADQLGWRLGCQAWSFHTFTFFEAVDKTVAAGLKYIEAFPGQKLSPEKPNVAFDHNSPQEVLDAVKAKLDAAGVKLVAYGVVDLTKDEAGARKVFEFAKKMGIETICSEPPPEQLPMVDKLANEYGISVAIHNHPKPSKYWNYETFLKAVQGTSKRIGACADTGHWMRSGLNPLEALKKLEGRIVSLHFKDVNEQGPDAHDVVWGTGASDAKAMLAELKRQGFKGLFSIEYEYNWENNVPEIAQCAAWFEKTAGELAK